MAVPAGAYNPRPEEEVGAQIPGATASPASVVNSRPLRDPVSGREGERGGLGRPLSGKALAALLEDLSLITRTHIR